jgi:hypothetical protein
MEYIVLKLSTRLKFSRIQVDSENNRCNIDKVIVAITHQDNTSKYRNVRDQIKERENAVNFCPRCQEVAASS